MGTIKVIDNDEYRAMQSLRRRPEMKIVRRVIERELAARGKTADQSDLAEMDALWDAAKAAERA